MDTPDTSLEDAQPDLALNTETPPPVAVEADPAPAPSARPSRRKVAKSAERQTLVLTTSKVFGPDGSNLARGRLVTASSDIAAELSGKGWAREPTAGEIARSRLPVVDLD